MNMYTDTVLCIMSPVWHARVQKCYSYTQARVIIIMIGLWHYIIDDQLKQFLETVTHTLTTPHQARPVLYTVLTNDTFPYIARYYVALVEGLFLSGWVSRGKGIADVSYVHVLGVWPSKAWGTACAL